jgi:hypothetical protein
MLGAPGMGDLVQGVAGARLAAATDSIAALAAIPSIERIILAHSPEVRLDLTSPFETPLVLDPDPVGEAFHFGRRLEGVIERYQLDRVFYLGAGSQPLLPPSELGEVVGRVAIATEPSLITNNLRSADWVGFNHASKLTKIASWLNRDNMLAWRLRENLRYDVVALPASAASRLDIDTPFDLQVLALHPHTPAHLRDYLAQPAPTLNLARLQEALAVLRKPGGRVTLIGRVSSAASDLLGARQLWTRVFSEERGMVASQRQAEGQVFSFIADHIERAGEGEFVKQLARTSDLVLFDTRVYMAHHHICPTDEERFASDLGLAQKISDARLRRLTEVVGESQVPILLGGHNVVSGGVYALAEIADYQP